MRAQGKGVIILVPEISLTPQTVRLFRSRFGQRVAVLHSGLTMAERADEYRRIQQGLAEMWWWVPLGGVCAAGKDWADCD